MKYDFTTVLDRHGRDSLAFDKIPFAGVQPDEGFDTIPMWIADMSFVAAPPAMEAILKRMEMPNFGYFALPDEYFDSIINWQRKRNGVEGLLPEHIGYENGVLGGVSSAVQSFTSPGDKILIHSPTYVGFTHTMDDTGRVIVHSELKRDENGIWRMDYEDMDRKIKENNIHFAIFCSPHNPCGRVWERWEIEQAMALYKKYDVMVVSDEIWSDILLTGYCHIPTQSVSEDARSRTVALYAPSKTFNLAGCQNSFAIIPDPDIRRRFDGFVEGIRIHGGNPFGYVAVEAAYRGGRQWFEQVRDIIYGNYEYVRDSLKKSLPGAVVSPLEGTYLLWIDFGAYLPASEIKSFMEDKCGLAFDYGDWFGGERFGTHIRMNLATSRELVEKAVNSIISNLK